MSNAITAIAAAKVSQSLRRTAGEFLAAAAAEEPHGLLREHVDAFLEAVRAELEHMRGRRGV